MRRWFMPLMFVVFFSTLYISTAQCATVSLTCTPSNGVALLTVKMTAKVTTTSPLSSVTKVVIYIDPEGSIVATPVQVFPVSSTNAPGPDVPGNNPGPVGTSASLAADSYSIYAWAQGYDPGINQRIEWWAESNIVPVIVTPASLPGSGNPGPGTV